MKQITESSALHRPPFGGSDEEVWFKQHDLSYAFYLFRGFLFVYEGTPMKRLLWNKHTKRVLKHLAGWFCIIVGIIMLITPGQGILSLLIGIYLLADEIPLFGRIKAWTQHRFPKMTDYVHRKGEEIRRKFKTNGSL